jgi:hypothetical protein
MPKRPIAGLCILIAATAIVSGAQSVKLANLEPDLRDALLRDAQCPVKPGVAPTDADRALLLQTPVNTQPLHGAGGHAVGVIVMPAEGCQCHNGNCTAYVYLKSQDSYRLALRQDFQLLRPMKSYKHGMPSLTGRYKVSDIEAATTVYDWDGNEYQATLCAKVTQGRDPRRPAIVKQDCQKR